MTKLAAILDQIDSGSVLLPEFQRGYVWSRDQVRGFMRSLYLGYPVGSLLTWETRADGALVRGGTAAAPPALRVLILDGQQRITSLYGITRGRPPAFFQGDERVFSGLRFHVEDETFEFYAPAQMRDDPRWIDVTSLYARGLEPHIDMLIAHPATRSRIVSYVARLTRLRQVLERDFHEEKLTGEEKSIDVVVDIFNLVNSGGTKLSKGDLALARKCVHWPEARSAMRAHLDRWEKEGFSFTLDWLLRVTSAVATGRAGYGSLDTVKAADFKQALESSARYVGQILDVAVGHLGLDHNRVLTGRYAFPVICRLLHLSGGHFDDQAQIARVLYWYIHSARWGRYAGSSETVLNQDCDTAGRSGVDGLIGTLERWRGGNLVIDGQDFAGSGQGSRWYPLLYLLTRVHGARDFGNGLPLHAQPPGHPVTLKVHHIFPKALLRAAGYPNGQVNAVANICFLTRETSLVIAKRQPAEYCAAVELRHPGALASQWIPQDPALWRIDRYPDFLAARRDLLAAAANRFLNRLRAGDAPGSRRSLRPLTMLTREAADTDYGTEQAQPALVTELVELGCADPAVDCEVSDPATGEVLAIAEACWPEGLRPGQGNPVILVLDPAETDLDRLKELGYETFTSADSLRSHVRRRKPGPASRAAEPPDVADDEVPLAAMRM
ncbi:MAG: GmrSD restriction endonuclease domain-containing protein [Trebonia sp.]